MTQESLTIVELFEKVGRGIQKSPEQVIAINSTFLFKVSGPQAGVYFVDLKENPGVSQEEKPAEVVLEIRDRDLLKMYRGVLPGYKAVLCGKLKVTGPLALATKLSDVFFAAKKAT